MIRSELVQRISEKTLHLYPRDAEKIVNAILEQIVSGMARGDRVEIRGFGTFGVKFSDAHTGRNPRTGKLILVPKKVVPVFRAAKEIRERLNRGEEVAGPDGAQGVQFQSE